MAVVPTQSCIPPTIEAGATIRFSVSNASYSSADWTLQFVLNSGIGAPLIVAGTTSGTGFVVTLTAAQTAALASGRYTWAEVFTSNSDTSEKAFGRDGLIDVLPSLLSTNAPSEAQKMVALLREALAQFSNKSVQSWSGAGQSFTRANIGDYQRQLTYWEARVIAEQAKVNALRGNRTGGEINVQFARPCTQILPFNHW